jgi:hypothetical protein
VIEQAAVVARDVEQVVEALELAHQLAVADRQMTLERLADLGVVVPLVVMADIRLARAAPVVIVAGGTPVPARILDG